MQEGFLKIFVVTIDVTTDACYLIVVTKKITADDHNHVVTNTLNKLEAGPPDGSSRSGNSRLSSEAGRIGA